MHSYIGYCQSEMDARILIQAAFMGKISRALRRLTCNENEAIKSGYIYIWEEAESHIKRWNDNRNWSKPRTSKPFLVYTELMDASPQSDPLRAHKVGGLHKQTFCTKGTSGTMWHMVAYHKASDLKISALMQPSDDPRFERIKATLKRRNLEIHDASVDAHSPSPDEATVGQPSSPVAQPHPLSNSSSNAQIAQPHPLYGSSNAQVAQPHPLYGSPNAQVAQPHPLYGSSNAQVAQPHPLYGSSNAQVAQPHPLHGSQNFTSAPLTYGLNWQPGPSLVALGPVPSLMPSEQAHSSQSVAVHPQQYAQNTQNPQNMQTPQKTQSSQNTQSPQNTQNTQNTRSIWQMGPQYQHPLFHFPYYHPDWVPEPMVFREDDRQP